MKTKISRRAIILSVVIILLLGCLSGCGETASASSIDTNKNYGKFREIPFGTKYKKVIELIEKDLEQQGYRGKMSRGMFSINTQPVDYKGIKLYDYTADVELDFYKKKDADVEKDGIFYKADYTIKTDEEKECYDYFFDKLKEKYGEGSPYEKDIASLIHLAGNKWEDEGTEIIIYTEDETLSGKGVIHISYRSKELTEQANQEIDQELQKAEDRIAEQQENANTGL